MDWGLYNIEHAPVILCNENIPSIMRKRWWWKKLQKYKYSSVAIHTSIIEINLNTEHIYKCEI